MTFIIATGTLAAGVQYDLTTTDSIYVPRNVNVTSTDSTAIINSGSNQIVTIGGAVTGAAYGIELGNDDGDTGNQLWVLAGGAVFGDGSAVAVLGAGARIENAGLLSGTVTGRGLSLLASGSAKTTINNSGLIIGSDAIIFGSFATAPVDITNTGQLMATVGEALNGDGYAGAIRLFNRGFILGDAELGEANDFYDGRGGTVQGNIVGRNGNDTFIAGAGAENINADGGLLNGAADILDFRTSASIKVALDESIVVTGNAVGDVYSNFEIVYGTAGADTIIGDTGNNSLFGFGGIDTLNGKAGADTLIGGIAKDILTGGGVGNDRFRFDTLADCGDNILDFSSNAAGNNDQIAIKALAFGGGLVAGAVVTGGAQPAAKFIVRADNLAQDANDRFIFRTTDKTLWFDSNGNGAGGLTLVADLQATATFTNLDIVLI